MKPLENVSTVNTSPATLIRTISGRFEDHKQYGSFISALTHKLNSTGYSSEIIRFMISRFSIPLTDHFHQILQTSEDSKLSECVDNLFARVKIDTSKTPPELHIAEESSSMGL